jgi:NTP pyrophosphatase (non-canonical NTP hydrolase)
MPLTHHFNEEESNMRNRETDYLYSLTMNDYQADTAATAIYKWKVVYPALGLASEAGEVCDKIKKLIRDHGIDQGGLEDLKDAQRVAIASELGDCLWYIAALSRDLGISLNEVAHINLEKLKSRQERGKLEGSGDNR